MPSPAPRVPPPPPDFPPPPDCPPPPWQTKAVNWDTTEAERERQAHNNNFRNHATHKRSSTQTVSKRKEEADDSPGHRAKAATASLSRGSIALLYGEEAERVMALRPTRLPDLVLTDPHEAKPSFHEDWTRDKDWYKEIRLREVRNRLIRENFDNGKTVFYKSSGGSMWPLCQSGDAVLMHPIRAVTARDGPDAKIKPESTVQIGDIVFCSVQRMNCYYTHLVLDIQTDLFTQEKVLDREHEWPQERVVLLGAPPRHRDGNLRQVWRDRRVRVSAAPTAHLQPRQTAVFSVPLERGGEDVRASG